MKLTMAIALTTLAISAFAGEAVLGVPFASDKFAVTAICPSNTDKVKRPCWIDSPFKASDGSRLGHVHLPNADQRPKWAEHAMFKIALDRDSRVQRLDVEIDSSNRKQIVESISVRFGASMTGPLNMPPRHFHTTWKNATAFVSMACSADCTVSFLSPQTQAEIARDVAARAAKDAARPKTP